MVMTSADLRERIRRHVQDLVSEKGIGTGVLVGGAKRPKRHCMKMRKTKPKRCVKYMKGSKASMLKKKKKTLKKKKPAKKKAVKRGGLVDIDYSSDDEQDSGRGMDAATSSYWRGYRNNRGAGAKRTCKVYYTHKKPKRCKEYVKHRSAAPKKKKARKGKVPSQLKDWHSFVARLRASPDYANYTYKDLLKEASKLYHG